jgi:O-antigen ligase
VAAVGVLAVMAPRDLVTAQQRLLSLGQYTSDNSVRYRVVESRFVIDRIRAHPVEGSGLAATIFWGRPWDQVPPKTYPFAHNGYLWLAWKIGIPSAALLVILFGSAVFLRAPPGDDDLDRALRHGAQGALAGLLLATVTFPSVSSLSITPVMGLLLAIAVAPAVATSGSPSSGEAARV